VLPIYIEHTLEIPKVVLLGLILAERERVIHTNTHTLVKLTVNPMKMRNTIAMPWSTTIRILCVSSRKKMKCKSLEVITCIIILLENTHVHTSLNPKIQKNYCVNHLKEMFVASSKSCN
jgi:hypothetical protein